MHNLRHITLCVPRILRSALRQASKPLALEADSFCIGGIPASCGSTGVPAEPACGRRAFSSGVLLGQNEIHCVCGLDPCLSPHCFATDWASWGGSFAAGDDRSLAPYQGTPDSVAEALFSLAAFRPGERFVDLGAGDGRVLLFAVERCGAAEATGWELDPAVHAIGLAHIAGRFHNRPDLAARVTLHCGDARDAALGADVVALYLLPEGMRVLRPVLEARIPKGSGVRVVTHGWPVPGWPSDKELTTSSGARLFLYIR